MSLRRCCIEKSVPRDMHDVVGYRLPDEIYYLVSIGALAPPQLNMLLAGIAYRCTAARRLGGLSTHARRSRPCSHARACHPHVRAQRVLCAAHAVIVVRWYDEYVDLPLNHTTARAEVQGKNLFFFKNMENKTNL